MNIEKEIKGVESLDKLQAIYKTYTIIIREALFDINTRKEPSYYECIFQNLLERNYYSIKAVDSLFDLYANDQNFKFTICVQIRAALLDAITTVYLANFVIKDNDETFKYEIARLNTLLAKEMKRQFDELSEDEKSADLLKIIKSNFPENFLVTNDGNISIDSTIKDLKPKFMCDEIKHSANLNLRWFGDCYSTYKRFSQYEHFNSFSKKMLDFEKELEFDHILFASYFIFYGSYVALSIINDKNERIERIKLILNSIKSEDLTFITN